VDLNEVVPTNQVEPVHNPSRKKKEDEAIEKFEFAPEASS
jgi:hypothetical protein